MANSGGVQFYCQVLHGCLQWEKVAGLVQKAVAIWQVKGPERWGRAGKATIVGEVGKRAGPTQPTDVRKPVGGRQGP